MIKHKIIGLLSEDYASNIEKGHMSQDHISYKSYRDGYIEGYNKCLEDTIKKELAKNEPFVLYTPNVPLINLLKECAHAIDIAISDEMGLDGGAGSMLLIRINTLLQGYKKYGED
jgi:hypothetical protein